MNWILNITSSTPVDRGPNIVRVVIPAYVQYGLLQNE